MADRQFNIEVLIKARNAAAQAMRDFAKDAGKADENVKKLGASSGSTSKSLDKVNTAAEKLGPNLKSANTEMGKFSNKLPDLNDRVKTFSTAALTIGNRLGTFNEHLKETNKQTNRVKTNLSNAADAQKNLNEQTRSLTTVIKALNLAIISKIGATEAAEKSTAKNTEAVKLKKAAVASLTDTTKDNTKATDEKAKASDRASSATNRHASASRGLSRQFDDDGNTFSRLAGKLSGLSAQSGGASNHLRELAHNARGLVLAFVVKYAQALATAIVGLGGAAVSAASSFISAGAAIGGAFTAGVLQAIPAVGLLLATLQRAGKVIEALKLRGQIKERSTGHDNQDAQRAKTDLQQVASAQDTLADALRNVTEAQDALTKARGEARREIEDLIRAERDAELAARGAALSQEEAQRTLRSALLGNSTAEIARARLGVATSNSDLAQRRTDVTRTGVDADKVRKGGIDSTDRVINARRALADAERNAAQASRSLANAQDDVGASAAGATAQEDRLAFLLAQLSPSERDLFKALTHFSATYKKTFREITDVIIDSFTRSVQRAESILTDNRIITAAKDLAKKIAKEIDVFGNFATGDRSRGFITFLSREAEFNLKSITDNLITASRAIFNIAEAAAPIFSFITDKFGDVVSKLEFDTRGNRGAKFFDETKKDLQAIFDLAGSVGRTFSVLFSAGRKTGRGAIGQLAEDIDSFNKTLEKNPAQLKKFFDDSIRVFRSIGGVVFDLGKEILSVFNASAIEDFARVIKDIFIPAVGNAVRAMGLLTRSLQIILDLPVIRELAQFAFSIFLFTKSLQVLRGAAASLVLVFGALFGAAGGAAPAFSPFFRTLILLTGALLTLKNVMDKAGISTDSLAGKFAIFGTAAGIIGLIRLLDRGGSAFKAYRTTVALQTAGAGTAVTGFARKSTTALSGLRAAFAVNPFGILVTGIALAVGALSLFLGHNEKAKHSVESLTDAIERQTDAYRALRDASLDQKDANLAQQNAEIRLANAKARVVEVSKAARKDGKVTAQEARDIKQANLDVSQSEIDLTRARRRSRDIAADKEGVERKAAETSKEVIKGARNNIAALKEERDKIKDKVTELKTAIVTAHKSGDKNLEIQFTKDLNREEEKLRQTNKKLATANDDLASGLRKAGRGFVRVKGNAEDFGLTFSDVLGFLEKGANSALGTFGAKQVKFATKYIKREVAHIPNFEGDQQGRAQGGFLEGDGLRDSIPVLAAPGEAVINRHQIPYVDEALRASGIMSGGLGELFSRVQTPHYMAKGGYVQQAAENGGGRFLVKEARDFAKRMFGLGFSVTSAFRPGDPRQHGKGQALDFGDSVNDLRRLWSYVYPIRAQFNQLLGPPGLFNGIKRFANPGLQAQHNDHIHIGFAGKLISGLGALTTQLGRVSISSDAGGFAPRLLRAMEKKIRDAGDKFVDKQTGGVDTFDRNIDFKKVKGVLSANQVRTFASRAIGALGITKEKSSWVQMLTGRAAQESTFNPNAINRTDINAQRGDPSRGLMQITGSNFKRFALPGRTNINNPFDNMLASIAYMLNRYGRGDPTAALQAMLQRNAAKLPYARGGFVRAASGLPPQQIAFNRNRATTIASERAAVKKAQGKTPDNPLEIILSDIRDFIKILRTGNKKSIAKAIRNLDDPNNGIIALASSAITAFAEELVSKLKARSIKISKGGKITKVLDDAELVQGEIDNAKSEQAALLGQRALFLKAERVAKRKGNRTAAREAKAARINIEAQIADLVDTIETKLEELQTLRDDTFKDLQSAIEDRADSKTSEFDRQKRLGAIVGKTTGFASQEADALTNQKTELQNLLNNSPDISDDLRRQVVDQISELTVQILEKSVEAVKETVDKVNAKADQKNTNISLFERLVGLNARRTAGGQNSALRGQSQVLGARGRVLQEQATGLIAARKDALANGQTALADDIKNQLAEIAVQIAENTVAQQENTDAIKQNAITEIISRNSFITGVFSQGVSVLQGVGNLIGSTLNTEAISKLINSGITSSQGAITSLFAQLKPILSALGLDPGSLNGLSSPGDIVEFLTGIAGTNTGLLTPAQQEMFQSLINEILNLTGGVVGLKEQLQDLTQSIGPQSFSTTAWSLFRQAIFNGEGSLLPQFASTIPQMHTGGLVTNDGLFNLQAGERVLSREHVSKSGKMEHNWYITSPTEIADPDYLASVMAFKLSTSSAVR